MMLPLLNRVRGSNPRILQSKSSPLIWTGRAAYQSHQGIFGCQPKALQKRLADLKNEVKIDFDARNRNSNGYRLIESFRRSGHIHAQINPVSFREQSRPSDQPDLSLERFGLQSEDTIPTGGLIQSKSPELRASDLQAFLETVYCGPIAVEFESVECEHEREWLYRTTEKLHQTEIEPQTKKNLAIDMLRSQNFDNFMATKFSNVKRYGGEGAESMMGIYSELISSAGENGVKEIVIGMAHRGRLNVMTGLFNYPPVAMFRKMRGLPEFPPEQQGAGDVLSHLTSSVDLPTKNGSQVHVTMLPNPSHLEAVNPVACGKVRARHLTQNVGEYSSISGEGELMGESILCLQVHGDAALIGQGINQETLQMSQVPHFSNGGSIHVVINNQVGFTTPGDRGRTSRYCSDLAKQIGAPVIHVNGDRPEEVIKATRLALAYQRRYRKDVFLDLSCYRRHGHNELDDPTFTNPLLYKTIHATKTIPDQYADQLVAAGVMSKDEVSQSLAEHNALCTEHYQMIDSYEAKMETLKGDWSAMEQPPSAVTQWDTGLPLDVLKYIGAQSIKVPEEFNLHPHLKKIHVDARMKKLESGSVIDWGTAECLAVGSLLYQGFNVRFSGQDVGRATFAHRHAMLVDQDSNEMFIPFNEMKRQNDDCGQLEMANSPLSEEAVLGFEYGMSVENPKNLIIWEAQFGDFFNGAQIILDTYVSCGESKWGLQSSLTLLLPHGMDGAGPEHSSCRMERFLQMTDSKESDGADGDDVNWHVVNPTTSAQYFHLLRRQMIRNFRKPLVVVGPKVLLRLPAASSNLSEMKSGTSFQTVLPDPRLEGLGGSAFDKIKRVVFVSGKHYYALARHADEKSVNDIAFVRVEQLCPFPTQELQEELKKFKNAKRFIWSQEEHRNMGAWSFVYPRFRNLVGVNLDYVGREVLCQPAVGVGKLHQEEANYVVEDVFK
ncbi:2-oxoadipate dehydrogenase complex component E1-like [Tigriopus californicus]|uniref:2-oxoadipate dehydrogenase complex component E1-like n=1 Tax=Tigriopus californicus TaxID=6832 RepID=UPI0027DAA700|nr:2-oxoadipate dehydrogenase complex component E1-like [Tigriopus californicus]